MPAARPPTLTRVLFVCHANIVRSPLAEGIFCHLLRARGFDDRFLVGSAGVSAYEGSPPDSGSVAVAAAHGITLAHRSRQLIRADLFDHDHVLVADRHVHAQIRRLMGGSPGTAHIRFLARLAAPDAEGEALDVLDPIGGGPDGFARMFAQVHRACSALLAELTAKT